MKRGDIEVKADSEQGKKAIDSDASRAESEGYVGVVARDV